MLDHPPIKDVPGVCLHVSRIASAPVFMKTLFTSKINETVARLLMNDRQEKHIEHTLQTVRRECLPGSDLEPETAQLAANLVKGLRGLC